VGIHVASLRSGGRDEDPPRWDGNALPSGSLWWCPAPGGDEGLRSRCHWVGASPIDLRLFVHCPAGPHPTGGANPDLRVADTLAAAAIGPVASASPAQAGRLLYAYTTGASSVPVCPAERHPSQGCSLGQALSRARAGTTVALATPGSSGHYVGNWTVATRGTSSSAPLTIEPAPGVASPTLDGNRGKSAGCQTKACEGPVLTIAAKVRLVMRPPPRAALRPAVGLVPPRSAAPFTS
jgi:hypothetical protein